MLASHALFEAKVVPRQGQRALGLYKFRISLLTFWGDEREAKLIHEWPALACDEQASMG